MRQTVTLVIAQMLIAFAAVGNVVFFELANMMDPARVSTGTLSLAAVVVAVTATVVMVFVARLRPARPFWIICLFIVTLGASFAPQIADAVERHQALQRRNAEDQRIEQALLRDLDKWKADIAARIAQRRPFAGADALDLLEFVDGADLGYRSMHDYSDVAVPLLQKALNAKILDPNVRVHGRHANDAAEEPLFLYFYRDRIAVPAKYNSIRVREWDLLQLLVAYGANVNDPDASALKSDLGRTVVKTEATGRFMRLQ